MILSNASCVIHRSRLIRRGYSSGQEVNVFINVALYRHAVFCENATSLRNFELKYQFYWPELSYFGGVYAGGYFVTSVICCTVCSMFSSY
jgi:hypothetical protein